MDRPVATALIAVSPSATPPSTVTSAPLRAHGNRLLTDSQELAVLNAVKRLDRPAYRDIQRIAAAQYTSQYGTAHFTDNWARGFAARRGITIHKAAHHALRPGMKPDDLQSMIIELWDQTRRIALHHEANRSYGPLVINVDESCVFHESKHTYQLSARGGPQPIQLCDSHTRECCTVILAIERRGGMYPAFVLFKGQNFLQLPPLNTVVNGQRPFKPIPPPHARDPNFRHPLTTEMRALYWQNEHGFMTQEFWLFYITLLRNWNDANRDILLFADSAAVHESEAVAAFARRHSIDLIMIPARCTCYIQPLDLVILHPWKNELYWHIARHPLLNPNYAPPPGGITARDRRAAFVQCVEWATDYIRANPPLIEKAFVKSGIAAALETDPVRAAALNVTIALAPNLSVSTTSITGNVQPPPPLGVIPQLPILDPASENYKRLMHDRLIECRLFADSKDDFIDQFPTANSVKNRM